MPGRVLGTAVGRGAVFVVCVYVLTEIEERRMFGGEKNTGRQRERGTGFRQELGGTTGFQNLTYWCPGGGACANGG